MPELLLFRVAGQGFILTLQTGATLHIDVKGGFQEFSILFSKVGNPLILLVAKSRHFAYFITCITSLEERSYEEGCNDKNIIRRGRDGPAHRSIVAFTGRFYPLFVKAPQ